jgi:hypothetical protein
VEAEREITLPFQPRGLRCSRLLRGRVWSRLLIGLANLALPLPAS